MPTLPDFLLMKINDVLSGALLGFLAAAIYLHAQSFPSMPGQNVGPNMFPQLIASGLMVCALILVFRGVRTLATQSLIAVPEWMGANRTTFGFVMIPVALLFYIAVSEWLGFLLTAAIMLLVLFLVFEVRLRSASVVAVAGALGIHYAFYKLLSVPLPWGVLVPFAW